jgi:transcriptional coactivator HFI1/ADA1
MNPADLTLTISPSQTKATLGGSAQKYGGTNGTLGMAGGGGKMGVERVNLEGVYLQLKAALGEHWADYKAALNAYVLGSLNQAELTWVLAPLFSGPAIIAGSAAINGADAPKPTSLCTLHNTLITSIYANTLRDPPPTDVAPWVVATDKPTSSAKTGAGSGANDQAEERLKREVMTLHARDRKRIKLSKETPQSLNDGWQDMQDYMHELAVKAPQQPPPQEPQSATATGPQAATGTLAKTSWDVEIRRRYAQSLASEVLEFPSQNDLQSRIEPICFEEGLTGGVQLGALQACAELIEQAAEVFVKEMLSNLLGHAHANAAGGKDGVQTAKFRRQLRKEEEEAERGVVQRTAGGLLPAELDMQAKREPLTMQDVRLAVGISDRYLHLDRFLEEKVSMGPYPELNLNLSGKANGFGKGESGIFGSGPPPSGGLPNGHHNDEQNNDDDDPDAMAVDDFDFPMPSFKGTDNKDVEGLMSALDDCLLAAGG